MMRARRRGLIVGLAVGNAAANNRQQKQATAAAASQPQTVIVQGYPAPYDPYNPTQVQYVTVPQPKPASKTTTVIVAAPPAPRPAYPPAQPPPGQYQSYPPQSYPPQVYPPQQAYPPQAYPPQGYPPQAYPPQAYPPQAYPPQAYPPQAYPPQSNTGYPAGEQAYPGGPPYPAAPPPYNVAYQASAPPANVTKAVAVAVIAVTPASERQVTRRYFMIVNEANCGVLEIEYGNARPGGKIVSDKPRPDRPAHQQWFVDNDGVIRSRMNEYALESKGGDYMVLMPYTGETKQKWVFKSNRIMNSALPGECVGLKKRLFLHDDADVIVSKYDSKPYQHWRMNYL